MAPMEPGLLCWDRSALVTEFQRALMEVNRHLKLRLPSIDELLKNWYFILNVGEFVRDLLTYNNKSH